MLKLQRIQAGMNATNAASIRVAEKIAIRYVRSGEGGGRWHLYEARNPNLPDIDHSPAAR